MPTLIFEDKFETGGTWDTSNGTPTIVSSPTPPSATKALQCNAIADYVLWNIPDSGFTRVVWGAWVYFDTFITTTSTRVFKVDAGTCEGWCVMTTSAGRLQIVGNGTPSMGAVNEATDLPATDSWFWLQLMFDVSANPWELRFNRGGSVISTTGAQAASNLDPGLFLLGNTAGGEALNMYFGHVKAGVAADDDDWWDAPTVLVVTDPAPRIMDSRGTSW